MDKEQFLHQGEEAMLSEPTQDPYFNCLPCAEEGIIRGASTLDSKGDPICDNHQLPD